MATLFFATMYQVVVGPVITGLVELENLRQAALTRPLFTDGDIYCRYLS